MFLRYVTELEKAQGNEFQGQFICGEAVDKKWLKHSTPPFSGKKNGLRQISLENLVIYICTKHVVNLLIILEVQNF